jgi:methionyl-tRNA formyltransferase
MTKLKKLIFFGSGPVGASTLLGLMEAGFEFEAIITKPRPAHHRGEMPVLDLAKSREIPVHTPASKSELSDIFRGGSFVSDLGVVVDYGIIINKSVINYFKFGIINSHFSLLPHWRGADPITFAILSGQDTTGVSLMVIDETLDTGMLLAQKELKIPRGTTTPLLTDQLVDLSNDLLIKTIPKYLDGSVKPYPQYSNIKPSYSRKLTKEDGRIDWNKPAETIEREVRAYSGWPRSFTEIFDKQVIITKARVAKDKSDGALVIKCDGGWLEIQELIAPSGRSASGADFMHGYKR